MKNNNSHRIIWDLPTRVFHWLTAAAFAVAWLTYDDNRFLYVHVFSGYSFLGLLVFRLLWGVVGTHYARFHSFAHDWRSVTEYLLGLLNGRAMRYVGHNPAGGWAIFIMLAFGLCVAVTGLLTLGGEEGHGPLAPYINYNVGIISREIHTYSAWIMLGMVAIHLIGVIAESVIHRDNIIWAMISGKKEAAAGTPGVSGHHLIGLAIVTIITVSSLFYFRGYIEETADHLYQPYQGPDLPDNALWRQECGECHFAFHPTLLPERSWRKIFKQQRTHFGDDLDLDEETLNELLAFHVQYPAESNLTEPARKILFYTPDEDTPIRVTETNYWVKKHEDIDPVYWKHKKVRTKSNCGACHLDADRGTYEDSDMRLPN